MKKNKEVDLVKKASLVYNYYLICYLHLIYE